MKKSVQEDIGLIVALEGPKGKGGPAGKSCPHCGHEMDGEGEEMDEMGDMEDYQSEGSYRDEDLEGDDIINLAKALAALLRK
jgi:hypothetical protein